MSFWFLFSTFQLVADAQNCMCIKQPDKLCIKQEIQKNSINDVSNVIRIIQNSTEGCKLSGSEDLSCSSGQMLQKLGVKEKEFNISLEMKVVDCVEM